jgi:hypothetical protein
MFSGSGHNDAARVRGLPRATEEDVERASTDSAPPLKTRAQRFAFQALGDEIRAPSVLMS